MKIKNESVILSQKAKEKILEYIKIHELRTGQKLPSEQKLQEMLGVSRYTVREALALLQQEKYVTKIHGKGTFVNKKQIQIESGLEKLESISEIIRSFGNEPDVVWLDISVNAPTDDMIKQLKITPDVNVITFKRIINACDKVAVFCVDSIPTNIIKEITYEELDNKSKFSMFNYLKNNYNIEIEYAITEIIPTTPTKEMLGKLDIDKNHMFLLLKQIHYNKEGKPIIYSDDYFNSNIFRFKVNRVK